METERYEDGKVVPELTGGTSIGYELVGVGYGLLGIAFVVYGHRRQQELDRALTEGGSSRSGGA